METLRTIWYDIRRDLKQVKDDLEVSDAQGMYWTLVVADRLRMQHIVKRRSGAFLTTFVLPVQSDATFTNRRYVVLPKSIYDLDLDSGVHQLSFYAQGSTTPQFLRVTFHRTDPARYRTRAMSFYQRATPDRPYFWREGSRLYLDLGESVAPNVYPANIEAKLYCNLPDITEVDALNLADQPLDFPKELLYPLKRAIIDMGRFVLSLPGQYLRNDGTNRPAQEVTGLPEKTVSVADPVVNTGAD
jgi:hypothetical protein